MKLIILIRYPLPELLSTLTKNKQTTGKRQREDVFREDLFGSSHVMSARQNPNDFLKTLLGRPVVVKLNSGVDYRGVLSCLDGELAWQTLAVARAARGTHTAILGPGMAGVSNYFLLLCRLHEHRPRADRGVRARPAQEQVRRHLHQGQQRALHQHPKEQEVDAPLRPLVRPPRRPRRFRRRNRLVLLHLDGLGNVQK